MIAVTDATHFQVDLKKDPGGPATVVGSIAEAYTQNRATLHLHGGVTAWISDGTPYQWTTPAGETTDYPKGVSVQNVPDMPDPGDGSETFFYSNQQSARLMFYHDHSDGITRLNVYAGEAAGYLLTDTVEQDLIARGVLPDLGTPLVIQDKTFVDPNSILNTDPTWPFPIDSSLDNLWGAARLHAEPESELTGRHEPDGPLGLRSFLLAPMERDESTDRATAGRQGGQRRQRLHVGSRSSPSRPPWATPRAAVARPRPRSPAAS